MAVLLRTNVLLDQLPWQCVGTSLTRAARTAATRMRLSTFFSSFRSIAVADMHVGDASRAPTYPPFPYIVVLDAIARALSLC